MTDTEIGAAIKAARIKKGLKQCRLAQILYMDRSTVSNWETGKRRIYLDVAIDVADILGITLDELIGRKV